MKIGRMRLPSWWRRADEATTLRPYLSATFSALRFTDAVIALSPALPGVYLLYRSGRLIYIGLAVSGSGIRQELESHQRGAYGPCTQAGTEFRYELTSNPAALYRQYLRDHMQRYAGRLPPCNDNSAAHPSVP